MPAWRIAAMGSAAPRSRYFSAIGADAVRFGCAWRILIPALINGAFVRLITLYKYNYAGAWANISGATPPGTIGPSGGATIPSTDRTAFENLYNDLLGRMSQTTVTYYSDLEKFQPAGTPRVRNFVFREQGYFSQDDWRIRPNLVLNLGLRWEFYGVPFEKDGYQGTVDQAARVTSWANISDLALTRTSKWYNDDWNNFAPRIGFAWSPGRSANASE